MRNRKEVEEEIALIIKAVEINPGISHHSLAEMLECSEYMLRDRLRHWPELFQRIERYHDVPGPGAKARYRLKNA